MTYTVYFKNGESTFIGGDEHIIDDMGYVTIFFKNEIKAVFNIANIAGFTKSELRSNNKYEY